MIASNFRKHADAMALQLPLPFGTALIWHTARPGSRVLRAIRAARSHAFKIAGRIRPVVKESTPQWFKDAKARARSLAAVVRDACLVLWAEVRVADTTPPRLVAFNYERDLDQAGDDGLAKLRKSNPYRARVLAMQREKELHHFAPGCPRCDHHQVRHIRAPVGLGTWYECTNCRAAWHPDTDLERARRELTDPDFDPDAEQWDERAHEELMRRRNQALEQAKCPKCGTKAQGWGPDWKRGVWTHSCFGCGHEYTTPIPH
jgi:hypothetical protein